MITKREYFKRNNYTSLIVLFTIFTLFSVITITKNYEYLVNRAVWSVPIIFVAAIVTIYFRGGAAYRNYARNFVKWCAARYKCFHFVLFNKPRPSFVRGSAFTLYLSNGIVIFNIMDGCSDNLGRARSYFIPHTSRTRIQIQAHTRTFYGYPRYYSNNTYLRA